VYVPQQDLQTFGVSEADLVAGCYDERFVRLMEHQAARARQFYAAAAKAYPVADARSLIAAEIMGGIYYALLEAIEARRFQVFGERITLPARRKVAIALRRWAAARLRRDRSAA
jgi:phytoene synthase